MPPKKTAEIAKRLANKESFMEDCTFYEYKMVGALNQSTMKSLVASPKWMSINQDFDHFKFGRQFHEFVLEPDYFNENYIVIEGDARKKEYKEAAAKWPAHKIVKGKDFDLMLRMSQGIRNNPVASDLLDRANIFEGSMFWFDKEYQLECKGRADALIINGKEVVILDLKTTKEGLDFKKSANYYDYDLQAAFYKRGLEYIGYQVNDVHFIVSEKENANECIDYHCAKTFIARGQDKLKRLFQDCFELFESGREGYKHSIQLD